MKIETCNTFTATIYCGLKKGYDETSITDYPSRIRLAREICQTMCNEKGLGLTFNTTEFIYTDGNELGIEVGLINYPRFPRTQTEIKHISQELAKQLMEALQQYRVSVVYPDFTIMLENEEITE